MASRARRFAPLREGAAAPANTHLPKLKNYMFGEMRRALGIPKQVDILEHIYGLPTPEAREAAMESVRRIERAAMAEQRAQPGLVELMSYLDARALPRGICTRNFDAPVDHLLRKFLGGVAPFHPIVTREFRPPKPHPAGILHIARAWGLTRAGTRRGDGEPRLEKVYMVEGAEVRSEEVGTGRPEAEGVRVEEEEEEADGSGLIMVGDSVDDMAAGRAAGAATVLLVNPSNEHLAGHENTDLVINRLDELIGILEEGFQGREI
ncbi:hypothetical protein VPNG_06483 [Cytospora leucostoma]|uniref:Uncharacterized protein n=1 Tax=Cytospora leucostoma TaxID=1230097 RepID=A0A423X2Q7_9PEZI|nr:hypothetical protein VPNG_06483 [Cytospora leucostoma]